MDIIRANPEQARATAVGVNVLKSNAGGVVQARADDVSRRMQSVSNLGQAAAALGQAAGKVGSTLADVEVSHSLHEEKKELQSKQNKFDLDMQIRKQEFEIEKRQANLDITTMMTVGSLRFQETVRDLQSKRDNPNYQKIVADKLNETVNEIYDASILPASDEKSNGVELRNSGQWGNIAKQSLLKMAENIYSKAVQEHSVYQDKKEVDKANMSADIVARSGDIDENRYYDIAAGVKLFSENEREQFARVYMAKAIDTKVKMEVDAGSVSGLIKCAEKALPLVGMQASADMLEAGIAAIEKNKQAVDAQKKAMETKAQAALTKRNSANLQNAFSSGNEKLFADEVLSGGFSNSEADAKSDKELHGIIKEYKEYLTKEIEKGKLESLAILDSKEFKSMPADVREAFKKKITKEMDATKSKRETELLATTKFLNSQANAIMRANIYDFVSVANDETEYLKKLAEFGLERPANTVMEREAKGVLPGTYAQQSELIKASIFLNLPAYNIKNDKNGLNTYKAFLVAEKYCTAEDRASIIEVLAGREKLSPLKQNEYDGIVKSLYNAAGLMKSGKIKEKLTDAERKTIDRINGLTRMMAMQGDYIQLEQYAHILEKEIKDVAAKDRVNEWLDLHVRHATGRIDALIGGSIEKGFSMDEIEKQNAEYEAEKKQLREEQSKAKQTPYAFQHPYTTMGIPTPNIYDFVK